ncbi:MAG: hypothetical protein KKC25_09185 [Proteobacteria bacterium]|nr:hypothetical protein [Pseudomonadota bacterium]MBU2261343.1 hypothetical protein [Pseudomonadota bacterium]
MIRDTAAGSPAARREKGSARRRGIAAAVFCLCLPFLASGCTPKLYSIDMRYQPTKVVVPSPDDGRKYSLTVASFLDRRKIDDPLLIGRVIKSDKSSIPILPKYVKATDAVATALRELLFKSGYAVSPYKPAWDLREETILPEWGTILVGGTIDELDVTCLDAIPRKRYTAKVKLTLVFTDVQKKRIFYRVTSESSSSLDHILFSEEKLESQINGVLSDAMEKAIEGPETGRQIREALKQ